MPFHLEDVDICVTCISEKPPKLPLREELPSLGVELVYRAGGQGFFVAQERARQQLLAFRQERALQDLTQRRLFRDSEQHAKEQWHERQRLEQELKSPHAVSYELYQSNVQPLLESFSVAPDNEGEEEDERDEVAVTTSRNQEKEEIEDQLHDECRPMSSFSMPHDMDTQDNDSLTCSMAPPSIDGGAVPEWKQQVNRINAMLASNKNTAVNRGITTTSHPEEAAPATIPMTPATVSPTTYTMDTATSRDTHDYEQPEEHVAKGRVAQMMGVYGGKPVSKETDASVSPKRAASRQEQPWRAPTPVTPTPQTRATVSPNSTPRVESPNTVMRELKGEEASISPRRPITVTKEEEAPKTWTAKRQTLPPALRLKVVPTPPSTPVVKKTARSPSAVILPMENDQSHYEADDEPKSPGVVRFTASNVSLQSNGSSNSRVAQMVQLYKSQSPTTTTTAEPPRQAKSYRQYRAASPSPSYASERFATPSLSPRVQQPSESYESPSSPMVTAPMAQPPKVETSTPKAFPMRTNHVEVESRSPVASSVKVTAPSSPRVPNPSTTTKATPISPMTASTPLAQTAPIVSNTTTSSSVQVAAPKKTGRVANLIEMYSNKTSRDATSMSHASVTSSVRRVGNYPKVRTFSKEQRPIDM